MQENQETQATEAQGSLLDALGDLRDKRASETTKDLPLPGFAGRLWATFRLPETGKVTQLSTLVAAGAKQLTEEAANMLAESTVGLYLASADAEAPILTEGVLSPGFEHLPGGLDTLPVNFSDGRIEAITRLCPPRPQGRGHTPQTRARALFNSDPLMVQAALTVAGWAIGGDSPGAIAEFSQRFRAGDQRE